ncbi:MAG: hypothetical protein WKG01_17055 [Kofleriaceae bacterium]
MTRSLFCAPTRGSRDQQQQRERGTHAANLAWAIVLAAGCRTDASTMDNVFYDGDGRKVLRRQPRWQGGQHGHDRRRDRARDRGEVLELYAHKPGVTVEVADIEHVLAGAIAGCRS